MERGTVGSWGRGLLLVAATLALATGWAVPAAAQSNEPFYDLQVTADPTSYVIQERLGEAEFELEISVVPQQSGAFNNQVTIRVTIEDASGAAPNGWSNVELSEDSFTMAPGAEAEVVTVTVRLTSNEVAQDQFPIQLVVTSNPEGGDPVTQTLYPNLNQEDEEEVQLSARRSLTTSESVTAFADQYKFLLLAAAAGVFLVAILLVRKKRSLALECDQPVQEVLPGRGASFPVRVINDSPDRDRIQFTHSTLPSGWTVLLPVETLELDDGETDTLWVTVKSPPTVKAGERVNFELYASSRKHPGQEAQTTLETTVVESFDSPLVEEPVMPSGPPPSDEPRRPPPEIQIHEPEPIKPARRARKSPAKKS